ncbi:MAG: HNH endonuclease [Methanobrevibacter thaueri]|uniref:HNH endonuclease signature motif containing protein n=1 Tax=Methanobrevibacter thaueri TaxID=190975 RepID=UPI0026ECC88E|nr:HNH endonuclease signature motif containing protein [Methanobrevibacter thaueri]MBE6496379.1 HNH endonuclease [Methanobrevibacter thaueri]
MNYELVDTILYTGEEGSVSIKVIVDNKIALGDNMSENPNYWKLLGIVKKLKEKDNKCFVCGSKEKIVPHHLKKVKQTSDEYYSENNLILLCDKHHHQYHQQYSNVNPKTFCEFLRDNFVLKIKESEINKVKKKRRLKMDIDLNNPLKISKLTKFIKLVNKTAKKTVKISVGDKLYGIRNVRDQEGCTILEIRGYKDGFVLPNYENDNFVMHIDYMVMS